MTKFTFSILFLFVSILNLDAITFDRLEYKKFTPRELQKDIDYLFRKFEEIHPNIFLNIPKQDAVRLKEELKNQITLPLTKAEFIKLISPFFMSFVKDGHNYWYEPFKDEWEYFLLNGGSGFPFEINIEGDKVLIGNSLNNTEQLKGTTILDINGIDINIIISKMRTLYNPECKPFQDIGIESSFRQWLWVLYHFDREFEISYIKNSIDTLKVTVTGIGKSQIERPIEVTDVKNQGTNWAFELKTIGDSNVGIITSKAFAGDWDNYIKFLDDCFLKIQDENVKDLILDFRENMGGNSKYGDKLMEYITEKQYSFFEKIDHKISREFKQFEKKKLKFKWYNYLYYPIFIRQDEWRKKIFTSKKGTLIESNYLPQKPKDNRLKFKGDLYLLTSNKTYSSANLFTAGFKCYNIGTVIGMPTGEPTMFTGDWLKVEMPNTKIGVAISKRAYILACPQDDLNGISPDILVTESSDDKVKGIDTVLKYTFNLILNKD